MPTAGSSPLTRGKRARGLPETLGVGLIPAHAGKTTRCSSTWSSRPAHPRSRGENLGRMFYQLAGAGSSPLTRGKRCICWYRCKCLGLIPAHAGKTQSTLPRALLLRAHPRSRGENEALGFAINQQMGSSPLTRGKPARAYYNPGLRGLIPAHAGKTSASLTPAPDPPAHPRSRGENVFHVHPDEHVAGSSPLTRGKHSSDPVNQGHTGLIPAHAGKTLPDLRFYRADRSDLGKP